MIEAALEYAKMGWQIFPCRPGTKYPATRHGVKDATSDEKLIRSWWERWPTANIGLACGPESGVFVIDIDLDHDKNIDGFESLKTFPDLPPTITAETPRGGRHYLFRADTPPANRNSFRPGIDVRADGYYIILAPSIHPNGGTYRWATGHAPGEIPLGEYPEAFRPEREKPKPLPWEKPSAKILTPIKSSQDIIERARAYLAQCEPAIEGMAGHDKLLWAARAMTTGFNLDDTTAMDLLWADFNPRCNPPWNESDTKDRKDFERKVSEARRTPSGKPAGWLLEAPPDNDANMIEYAETLRESILKATTAPKQPTKTKDTDGPPEALLSPPGLVGEICQWINDTALKSQPLLSLAASLTFCGALFGRKIKDQWDNRTNLYVMSVAPSSAGKDHARKKIKSLIESAGITQILGGEDVTSDAAIEKRMETNPVSIFLMDEIGHLMQSIKSSGASSPHLAKILPCLMKLYSSASNTYIGKEYAALERREIIQPCCCLYGTTTPEKLCNGITPDEIQDGWLGRVLVFVSQTNPQKDFERASYKPVPQHLTNAVKTWWERSPQPPLGAGDIESDTAIWQITVPTTPEAHQAFLSLEDIAERKASQDTNKGVDKLWGKAGELSRRVGLIIAAGDRYENPEIELKHAIYSCELIKYLIKELSILVGANIASNEVERDKQRLMALIKQKGPKGVSKNELTRKTQHLKKRQRDEYLADMAEARLITLRIIKPKTGRPKEQVYEWPYGIEARQEEPANGCVASTEDG